MVHTRSRAAVIAGLVATALAGAAVQTAPAHAIGGGSPAAEGSYRFVAKINIGEVRSCSGALVSPRWVLTAATCFAESPGQAVAAGPPKHATTATIGRTNLTTTTGHEVNVTMLVPRPDRNAVLAKLARPVYDVTPIKIGATAPATGELLRVAGYGRTGKTASEWVPDLLHTATFSVQETTATTFNITDNSPADASTCKGDSGGPAFREVNGGVELVGLNSTSWQHRCVETETRRGATETRVDDLADWVTSTTRERPESDVNGDGKADLLGYALPDGEWLYDNPNTSTVGKPSTGSGTPLYKGWRTVSKQVFADFDGDGKTDIIGRQGPNLLLVWLNQTTTGKPVYGSAIKVGHTPNKEDWANIGLMAFADVDGDGKVDILGYDKAENDKLTFFLNTGTVGNVSGPIDGTPGWRSVSQRMLADFDGDGKADIVGRHGAGLLVWLNTSTIGKPAYAGYRIVGTGTKWNDLGNIALTDLDRDGLIDVLGYNLANGLLYVVLNTSTVGNPSTVATSFVVPDLDWRSIREHMYGDFDGDGKTDIIGRQGDSLLVWLNRSTVGKPAVSKAITLGPPPPANWRGIMRFIMPGNRF